jgi:hypothetical protein
LYNYGIFHRPWFYPRVAFAASYIGAYSVTVFDLLYNINRKLAFYFTLSKSDNPQAKMMGQDKEIKGVIIIIIIFY